MKKRFFCIMISVFFLISVGFSAAAYEDVAEDAWYTEAVAFVTEQGWMEGVGQDQFAPEIQVSRAMAVTVLWRMDGAPEAAFQYGAYPDLPDDQWYSQAASWAFPDIMRGFPIPQEDPPVPTGYSLTFEGERSLTREQLAVVLYRYHCLRYPNTNAAEGNGIRDFPDGGTVSPWALEGITWCVEMGLLHGSQEGEILLLDPQGEVTRAQLAAVLMRYCGLS